MLCSWSFEPCYKGYCCLEQIDESEGHFCFTFLSPPPLLFIFWVQDIGILHKSVQQHTCLDSETNTKLTLPITTQPRTQNKTNRCGIMILQLWRLFGLHMFLTRWTWTQIEAFIVETKEQDPASIYSLSVWNKKGICISLPALLYLLFVKTGRMKFKLLIVDKANWAFLKWNLFFCCKNNSNPVLFFIHSQKY